MAGRRSYDTLDAREQELVRAAWDQRMTAARAALDLEAEFTAAGQSWVEADPAGRVVVRGAMEA